MYRKYLTSIISMYICMFNVLHFETHSPPKGNRTLQQVTHHFVRYFSSNLALKKGIFLNTCFLKCRIRI